MHQFHLGSDVHFHLIGVNEVWCLWGCMMAYSFYIHCVMLCDACEGVRWHTVSIHIEWCCVTPVRLYDGIQFLYTLLDVVWSLWGCMMAYSFYTHCMMLCDACEAVWWQIVSVHFAWCCVVTVRRNCDVIYLLYSEWCCVILSTFCVGTECEFNYYVRDVLTTVGARLGG